MHSETWLDIATDPNHIIAELVWTAIFDGIVIALFYNTIWKKLLLPRLRHDIHKEIDLEHGIDHEVQRECGTLEVSASEG